MNCPHDTNSDGDCELCSRDRSCPMSFFPPDVIARAVLSERECNEFISGATRFEVESHGIRVIGFKKDGKALLFDIRRLGAE